MDARTPGATKALLTATVVVTAAVALLAAHGGVRAATTAGAVLAVLTALFVARVVGQLVLLLRAPA